MSLKRYITSELRWAEIKALNTSGRSKAEIVFNAEQTYLKDVLLCDTFESRLNALLHASEQAVKDLKGESNEPAPDADSFIF